MLVYIISCTRGGEEEHVEMDERRIYVDGARLLIRFDFAFATMAEGKKTTTTGLIRGVT